MIILASASSIRQTLLRQACVAFEVMTLPVDEQSIKIGMAQSGASALDTAIELAYFKAYRVSLKNPGRLVVGADQMLEVDGKWLDKATSLAEVDEHLRLLRDKTHRLISALVIVKDGERIWHTFDVAKLTMRSFGDDFLEDYIKSEGDDLMSSVGAYKLEGRGIQLFSRIDGDYFTILGLPLLALLDFLRHHQEVAL